MTASSWKRPKQPCYYGLPKFGAFNKRESLQETNGYAFPQNKFRNREASSWFRREDVILWQTYK